MDSLIFIMLVVTNTVTITMGPVMWAYGEHGITALMIGCCLVVWMTWWLDRQDEKRKRFKGE